MAGADRRPRFSVCIPAYNRAALLPALLDSVAAQSWLDYEVLICEDASPERDAIRAVVQRYGSVFGGRLRYEENDRTLGYDRNLRRLIERAAGEYCVFVGNDDLLAEGALQVLEDALGCCANVGVILRSYATFQNDPAEPDEVFRYFPGRRIFEPGLATVASFYRRLVVISGLTVHRDAAARLATDACDGTLLYQLHVCASLLLEMPGVSVPEVIAMYRTGGAPDFGASEAERGRHVPGIRTPESSLDFISGMLRIARQLSMARGVNLYGPVLADLGNYSYPLLAIQARQSRTLFLRYAWRLRALGFQRSWRFHVYLALLLGIGPAAVDRMIVFVKQRLGRTPRFGAVYEGRIA